MPDVAKVLALLRAEVSALEKRERTEAVQSLLEFYNRTIRDLENASAKRAVAEDE